MKRGKTWLGSVLLCGSVLVGMAWMSAPVQADWPQWRGKNRDGVVRDFEVPANLPQKLDKEWSIEVGTGHSSPVLSEGMLIVHTGDGTRETIRCVDAKTGQDRWTHSYSVATEKIAAVVGHYGNSPRSTPSIAGDRVIAMGASGLVTCLNRESGQVLWSNDFRKDFPIPYPEFGAAASPLIVDSIAILHVGGPQGGMLAALKLENGEPVWTLKDDGPSYSSAVEVAQGKDKKMLVTQTQKTFTGIDMRGKRVWELPFETPYMQNIITTTLAGDLMITGGTSRPLQAYRIQDNGKPKRIWENKAHSIYMNSTVVIDGMVIGVSEKEKGHLFAVDLESGKTLWKKFQRLGENCEVLVCDRTLVLMTDTGKLSFLSASKSGVEVIREYELTNEPVTTHPILDSGRVYIKDRTKLHAFKF